MLHTHSKAGHRHHVPALICLWSGLLSQQLTGTLQAPARLDCLVGLQADDPVMPLRACLLLPSRVSSSCRTRPSTLLARGAAPPPGCGRASAAAQRPPRPRCRTPATSSGAARQRRQRLQAAAACARQAVPVERWASSGAARQRWRRLPAGAAQTERPVRTGLRARMGPQHREALRRRSRCARRGCLRGHLKVRKARKRLQALRRGAISAGHPMVWVGQAALKAPTGRVRRLQGPLRCWRARGVLESVREVPGTRHPADMLGASWGLGPRVSAGLRARRARIACGGLGDHFGELILSSQSAN